MAREPVAFFESFHNGVGGCLSSSSRHIPSVVLVMGILEKDKSFRGAPVAHLISVLTTWAEALTQRPGFTSGLGTLLHVIPLSLSSLPVNIVTGKYDKGSKKYL